jgi:hypothetical protein
VTYFALVPSVVDGVGIVKEVIRADQDFIDTGLVGDPSLWIRTDYNTHGNVYYIPNTNTPDPDQSKAFRANYAGKEFTWDSVNNVFYAPCPGPNYVLDEQTWTWVEV